MWAVTATPTIGSSKMPNNPAAAPSAQTTSTEPGNNKRSSQTLLSLGGAVLLPFLLISIYLLVTRVTDLDSAVGDYVALISSGFVGLALLCCAQIPKRWRFGLGIIYIPLIGYLLFFYSFMFIATVYGVSL